MSIIHSDQFVCPICNNKFQGNCYESINISLDQKLFTKLLNNEINFLKCPSCNQNIFHNIPLLFHDMDLKYALWYNNDGNIQVKDHERIDGDILNLFKKKSSYVFQAINKTNWEEFMNEIINFYNQTLGEQFIIDIKNGLYKPRIDYLKCLKFIIIIMAIGILQIRRES